MYRAIINPIVFVIELNVLNHVAS